VASKESCLKPIILPACHVEIPRNLQHLLAAPTCRADSSRHSIATAEALAKADHFRAAHRLLIINFNLHATTLPTPVGQMLSNLNYFLPMLARFHVDVSLLVEEPNSRVIGEKPPSHPPPGRDSTQEG
jgi:hypothetical protein